MHHVEDRLPPSCLLLHRAHALMGPTTALGRLIGPRLTPVTLVSGLLIGVYAYLSVTGRVALRHGRPLFPAPAPLPAGEGPSLLCESSGAAQPSGALERLLHRRCGGTTAEATASVLVSLTGFAGEPPAAMWHTRYTSGVARLCPQPSFIATAEVEALGSRYILPFLAADPALAQDLAAECLHMVGWLHEAQTGALTAAP